MVRKELVYLACAKRKFVFFCFFFFWKSISNNIALENTEEYVNGVVKNRYGDCFIRGNNGESGSLHLLI